MAERVYCPNCGHSNSPHRVTCKECGQNLKDPLIQSTAVTHELELSAQEASAILDREVAKYVERGFRVISRTDATAQLVKPKSFSMLWFFILMFTLIGWGFYVVYYLAKKDETIYLQVLPNRKIRRI